MTAHRPGAAPRGGADDAQQFEQGCEAGQYPRPATASVDGATLTIGTSPWLGMRCGTCNQTFRRGDQVWANPDRGIQHLVPALHCASARPGLGGGADEADGDAVPTGAIVSPAAAASVSYDAEQFTAGLLREWPPLNGAPVTTLTQRDWQVTRPGSGPASVVCPGCGHTFRAGDTVIICPCAESEDDERYASCQLAVHRDPAAGLACWDDWRPDARLIRCPRTHEKLPD